MSDADALLSAIVANPDEDDIRLVYADILDEHGDHDRDVRGGATLTGDFRRGRTVTSDRHRSVRE